MSKPEVTVVDAVMGTGKSKWVELTTKALSKRTIIILPRKTEVANFKKAFKDINDVVAIDDSEKGKRPRREWFVEALRDAKVIIATHQLFEDYLSDYAFDLIDKGEWSLVIDEVPTVYPPIKSVEGTSIDGLLTRGALVEEKLSDSLSKLTVDQLTYKGYLNLPATEVSQAQKEFLEKATIKDILIVKNQRGEREFKSFSLKEERLDVFKDITVLTYPFIGSDLYYWLQIKGYDVKHLELSRNRKTNSLTDFKCRPHDGEYSGKQFRSLIEFVEEPPRRGRGTTYGSRPNHFSASEMKRFVDSRGWPKKDAQCLISNKNTMRREFRSRGNSQKWVEPENFMFTCLKGSIALWKDRQRDLNDGFIGDDNWVAFNTLGVNDYKHKTNLAFLHNIYPFPEIEKVIQCHNLEYNRDQYALYTLIQWIWRSAIRERKKIKLYIPSSRMRQILEDWLEK